VFNRFTEDARSAVTEATDEARELGSPTVEAEHLLLALTRSDNAAAAALRAKGLDHDAVAEALAAETERSLAAVGVSADAVPFSPYVSAPKLATSSKLVLEHALRIAVARRDREITARHLALAILQPDRGTVPRALAIAGFDRDALRDELG